MSGCYCECGIRGWGIQVSFWRSFEWYICEVFHLVLFSSHRYARGFSLKTCVLREDRARVRLALTGSSNKRLLDPLGCMRDLTPERVG